MKGRNRGGSNISVFGTEVPTAFLTKHSKIDLAKIMNFTRNSLKASFFFPVDSESTKSLQDCEAITRKYFRNSFVTEGRHMYN